MGEPFLLHQALSNLLDNAIAFSPDGGQIVWLLQTGNGKHMLILQDDGVGIPDYALPRIFERFYSLARPNTKLKSTGLGLAFVREIAFLHGGEITLANRSGSGAGVEARLTLPAI